MYIVKKASLKNIEQKTLLFLLICDIHLKQTEGGVLCKQGFKTVPVILPSFNSVITSPNKGWWSNKNIMLAVPYASFKASVLSVHPYHQIAASKPLSYRNSGTTNTGSVVPMGSQKLLQNCR